MIMTMLTHGCDSPYIINDKALVALIPTDKHLADERT